MKTTSRLSKNLKFFAELLKSRIAIRALLLSDNILFARDFPPGHFYSPLPDIHDIRGNANTIFDRLPKSLQGIDIREVSQLKLLDQMAAFYKDLPFPEQKNANSRYWLDNPFFSYGDGITLGCLLRLLKPKRVVEVGSGFSSAAMLDTADCFFEKKPELTFIEPYPERLQSLLSDSDRKISRIEVAPVQDVDLGIFTSLGENDILFIDSSHVGKIRSDVLHILFTILPVLHKGVIIHFHDIMWPFEYPQNWLEQGRAWNEAYLLRAFLQYNSAFEVLYFNSFMAIHHSKALGDQMPMVLKSPSNNETLGNSSLWLRKRA